MEFGRVTPDELDSIDFTLPPDRPESIDLLPKQKQETKPGIYVGCAKWGRPEWVGTIYPKGTKERDFLEHYAQQFNTIELNATFYRLPTRKQTSAWKSKVGKDFRFCPKFTNKITHIKRLKDVQDMTDFFLESIAGFDENLGPVFLMVHPAMGPKALDTLGAFLSSMPKHIEVFTELRHKDWFADEATFGQLTTVLNTCKTGLVLTDVAGRRDCLHMYLNTGTAFIRFVGNGLHPTDYKRIDDWVDRLTIWLNYGIRNVYFFMHQHDELHSPILSRYLIEQLNLKAGTALKVPEFVG
jgi:uncharacterized protein YecE (DUF72 family)